MPKFAEKGEQNVPPRCGFVTEDICDVKNGSTMVRRAAVKSTR